MKITIVFLFILTSFIFETLSVHMEYYDLLGVPPFALQKDIKKAYRKIALQYFPDRYSPEEVYEKFIKPANAFAVLSDPKKRRKYDQYGPDFENKEHQTPNSCRGPELAIKVPVTLEDIYFGKEIGVLHTKQIICPHCRGSGLNDPYHLEHCNECGGQGYLPEKYRIGPDLYPQALTKCDKCGGTGLYAPTCHICKGAKVITFVDRFNLYIERGVKNGQKISFPCRGNEFPGEIPFNIAFEVVETPHSRFKREGDNLRTTVELSLVEAFLGFEKEIVNIDGYPVTLRRDFATLSGDVEEIEGEGMLNHECSSDYGDLFVEYKVNFKQKERI